jgi:hypothetical protein
MVYIQNCSNNPKELISPATAVAVLAIAAAVLVDTLKEDAEKQ